MGGPAQLKNGNGRIYHVLDQLFSDNLFTVFFYIMDVVIGVYYEYNYIIINVYASKVWKY